MHSSNQQQYGATPGVHGYSQGGGYGQGAGYGQGVGFSSGYGQDPNAGYSQEPEMTEQEMVKAMKKERKKERDAQSASCGFWTIILLGFFASCLWMIPIFGGKWHAKMFVGFGVGKGGWHITTSLLHIDMNLECGGKLGYKFLDKVNPETALCKLILPIMGKQDLAHFKEFTCAMPGSGETCGVATQLYFSSFVPFLTSSLTSAFDVLGLGFLWHYWQVQPLKDTLWYARAWLTVATFVGITGFITFVLVTPDLGDIPRAWGSGMPEGLLSLREAHDMPFGWCFFMTVAAAFFQLVLGVVWLTFFRPHVLEKQTEKEEERRKDAIEAMYDEHNCRWDEEAVYDEHSYPGGPPQQHQGYGATAQQPYAGAPQHW